MQEACLRAFRFFDGFDPTTPGGGDGKAWLLAVVRNTCLTWLGRKTGGSSAHRGVQRTYARRRGRSRQRRGSTHQERQNRLASELRGVAAGRVPRGGGDCGNWKKCRIARIAEVARVPVGTVLSRLSAGPRAPARLYGGEIMTCKSALALIEPYLDGELDAAQNAEIGRHLEECPECSAAHRKLSGLRTDMRTLAPRYGGFRTTARPRSGEQRAAVSAKAGRNSLGRSACGPSPPQYCSLSRWGGT